MEIVELLAIAFIRFKLMKTPLLATVMQVVFEGGIVFAVGFGWGRRDLVIIDKIIGILGLDGGVL